MSRRARPPRISPQWSMADRSMAAIIPSRSRIFPPPLAGEGRVGAVLLQQAADLQRDTAKEILGFAPGQVTAKHAGGGFDRGERLSTWRKDRAVDEGLDELLGLHFHRGAAGVPG